MNPDIEKALVVGAVTLIAALVMFFRGLLTVRARMIQMDAQRIADRLEANRKETALREQAEQRRLEQDNYVLSQAKRGEELNQEIRRINELRAEDRENNAALINEVSNLKRQLELSSDQGRERDTQIGKLQGHIESLDKENTELKRRLVDLEDSARNLSAINATLRSERDQALHEKVDLHAEIARLTERVTTLEKERDELKTEIAELRSKFPNETAIPTP